MSALDIVIAYACFGAFVGVVVQTPWYQIRVLRDYEVPSTAESFGIIAVCVLIWPVALVLAVTGFVE